MSNDSIVEVAAVKGSDNEFIIKDNVGISLGRFFIVEISKENQFCSIRIKFNKNSYEYSKYLKEAINLLLISLFRKNDIRKVNIHADQDINLTVFIDLGFELEGIISDSIKIGREYKSEFVFGIDVRTFGASSIRRNLMLEGKEIELRILTPENAEDLLEYYLRNKEYLKPFESSKDDSFYTIEWHKKDLIENYKQYLNGHGISLGIFKEDKFIGKIRISNIVIGAFKNAIIGYSIDEKEQGKGYMKEAVNLIVNYAFGDLDLHRIEASTLVDNIKSQAVLKACGFKEVGVSEKYLFINGEWRDHVIFYKIRD